MTTRDSPDKITTHTLPKSATTTFTTPTSAATLLPRSTTTSYMTPAHAITTAPKTMLSTLINGLKSAAKAVTGRKNSKQSSMSQIMEEARLEQTEEIDEWEEVDGEEVRDEMRRERLRLTWEREHVEKEKSHAGGVAGDEGKGGEPAPHVYTRRRRVRHWDSESEDEGEVIEIV